jgi:hypothetical protein
MAQPVDFAAVIRDCTLAVELASPGHMQLLLLRGGDREIVDLMCVAADPQVAALLNRRPVDPVGHRLSQLFAGHPQKNALIAAYLQVARTGVACDFDCLPDATRHVEHSIGLDASSRVTVRLVDRKALERADAALLRLSTYQAA